ncbi:major paralogous domain-containing protein [Fibrobacter sp. UWT2]|nr:major paralogous domain-containing protein [Fibrobacter sp. UWT2]
MALVVSCGDDSSDKSPVQVAEESSSSEFERSSSSIQNVTPVSSEATRSSSSICEDCDESSSSVTPQSSSSETSVSSSSAKSSSSSAKVEDSSSSAKVDESSSSVKSAESSSSVKVEESSSSEKNEISSSSEKPVESSSSEKVVESSSSEKSSSSAGIPSKLYDCEIYKCVTTKYLNPDIEYGEYLDVRDSQVYRTVQIGEQVWMAQNLNYKSDMQSFCFDNDDNNCAKWGRLYTWAQAVKACPEGWKLPDSSEYGSLAIFLKDSTGNKNVGKYLKTGKNNLFGFSVLLGAGYFVGGPDYFNEGGETYGRAYFWTASETDEQNTLEPPDKYAIIRSLKYSNDIFGILPWEKQDGLSVRCLKNL